jgi:hypothetical protein
MNRPILGTCLACLLATVGCDRVGMKEREAENAQRSADEEKRTADNRVDAARAQAEVDVNKAQDEARRDINKAQGAADQKQSAADVLLVQTRDDYVKNTEKALFAFDKRRNDVERRPKKGTEAQRSIVSAALKDVADKESAVRIDLKELQASTASTFDYAKSKVDRQLADLKKAIDDLENHGG